MEVAKRDVPPSPPMVPKAALTELLGSKASSYAGEVTSTAPFRLEQISWPEHAGQSDLLTALPPETAVYAADFEQKLLLSAAERSERRTAEGPARTHWDSVLENDRAAYLSLVRELLKRKMICFHTRVKSHVGIFFVCKSPVNLE